MFESIGISVDYLIIGLSAAFLILLIVCIVLAVQIRDLKYRYRLFMSGKDGKSLENALSRRVEQIDELMVANSNTRDILNRINQRTSNSFNKYGLFKYDAFDDGGQLSFALALLDDNNDGFVLHSIHNGEGCFVYMKEIIGGNSYTKLSPEEQEAVDRAKEIEE